MNRINRLFNNESKSLLSVYFCAGYPALESTEKVIHALDKNGVDMALIGLPSEYSKAGTLIVRDAATGSPENEMTLSLLFQQLRHIRRTAQIPLILLNNLNDIAEFGIESYCRKCVECGIDGVIIPDLSFEDYQKRVRIVSERYGLLIMMFVTPDTSDEKIELIDKHTSGFICMMIPTAETDEQKNNVHNRREFFKKIKDMKLTNSLMAYFDVNTKSNFQMACEYASGAIVSNGFMELLTEERDAEQATKKLIQKLKK
ncbi:Tryptophan synthase alpha chain [termite gut metagenome]|uniref:tryptophan synthase n=1 Tax=termite gut metagenome TaxID=433724 RepID=A0A5J4RVB3_9ZZZZ